MTDTITNYSPLEQHLLNDFQYDMSLSETPFADMAKQLGVSESEVLASTKSLQERGVISRVGPVFKPNTIGISTLAAMSVPDQDVQGVAKIINSFVEVNHNYQREHDYNLWFVVTAPGQEHLDIVLYQIERQTGYSLLSLPMLKDYFIDLAFDLVSSTKQQADTDVVEPNRPAPNGTEAGNIEFGAGIGPDSVKSPATRGLAVKDRAAGDLSADDRALIRAVEHGLPIVSRPYRGIARLLNNTEQEVISRLQRLIDSGSIKRYGIVVRHLELGYTANGMVVWDVPDDGVDELGIRIGKYICVALSYQRPRRLPQWPYNLFTMVHGRNRQEVMKKVEGIIQDCNLQGINHTILFSTRRFKQRGAQYSQSSHSAGSTAAKPVDPQITHSRLAGGPAPGLVNSAAYQSEEHDAT